MFLDSRAIDHGYVVVRASADDLGRNRVPIGVVAWDTPKRWYDMRFLDERERLPKLHRRARGFTRLVILELRRWAAEEMVPYAEAKAHPWQSDFWRSAGLVMTTAIQFDAPRAMEPMVDLEAGFEALYDALVQPIQDEPRRRGRLTRAMNSALGDVGKLLQSRTEVVAFGGAREKVLKGATGTFGTLVVEGVNLAGEGSRRDADALVSRLERIQAAYAVKDLYVVIGYCASPGGLNGEAHMRDWIKERVTPAVFDLTAEPEVLKEKTRELAQKIGV